MSKSRLIFVGGFLGAGKTTLLYEVTRILSAQGKQVGLITNDQAPDLVDTSLLEHIDVNVAEVAGSCFCCDFKGLRKALDKVGKGQKTDVILAEPVGSCTDLSATLINPIQDMMKTEISVSPLTVLVDPDRLKDILDEADSTLHPSAAYIIKKQMEESDILVLTKTDLYGQEEISRLTVRLREHFPDCGIMAISAKTGEGVDTWLDHVLSGENAGKHIVDVDYDKYAEGEAVLGWLNCSASLSGSDTDWDLFARTLMDELIQNFDQKKTSVGHVKMILENGDRYTTANLTGRSETLNFRWSAGTGSNAELIVNARVEMEPDVLKQLFLKSLDLACNGKIKAKINRIRSISPGYPNPTYRYPKTEKNK